MALTLFTTHSKSTSNLLASCPRVLRSLSVGIFISVDYWWTTNVALRGQDEVSSFRKSKLRKAAGNTCSRAASFWKIVASPSKN